MEDKEKLNLIKEELEKERKNLIYMLCHIDIENINLLNFHYKFNDLIIKKQELENKLYYNGG